MIELWLLIFVLGLIMMAAEIFIFTFGVFALIGAIMFFSALTMASVPAILWGFTVTQAHLMGLGVAGLLILVAVVFFGIRAYNHRAKPLLEGETVTVLEWTGNKGRVSLAGGEIWDAVSDKPFAAGDTASIAKIDNLTLTIH